MGRAALLSLALVISLLIADAWLGYTTIRDLNERALHVAQSHQVIDAAAELRDVVQEAVIGASRFVVTGEEEQIGPYEAAIAQVKDRMKRLTELTQDNPTQRERAVRVERQVGERLGFADKAIRTRREQGYEAARKLLAREFRKEQLDVLREEFTDLTATEQATLGWREELAKSSYQAAIVSTVLAAIIGLTLLTVALWLTRRDLLLRQHSESLVRESEARFRTVVESAVDGIIVINRHGIVQSLNPASVQLFGYGADEVIGRNVSMLMPEPDRGQHDQYLHSYITTGQAKIIGIGREVNGRRKDGSILPIRLSVTEASLAGDRIFIGSISDISERKRAEERLNLLVGELRHRVKNLISVMKSITTRTMIDGRSLDEAREIITGRLQALGRAHDLLIRASWQGAPLRDVVQAEVEGFSERLTVLGPDIVLNASATQTFALALHELATNAAKYGSLSAAKGRVSVRWWLSEHPEGPRLEFRWVERGGPPAIAPEGKGFGLMLLNEAMMSDFDKRPTMRFTDDGFEYEVDAPLAVVAAHADHLPPDARAAAQ